MRSVLTWKGRFIVAALSAAALSAAALSGCASMNVSSYVQRGTDLGRFRTYDWGPAAARSTGDPRLDSNPFFDRRVRDRVEEALARRGFEKADEDAPDLLVHYHASVTQKIDVRELDQGYAYTADDDRRPYVYDEGTLFVDLIDPRTNTLVWRGWAEGSIAGAIDDQDWMEARVDEAVARIMERLPRGL